ncbi:MAG: PIN domain-containing protein [Erysipelotrichaceae bacterium]
MTCVCIDTNLFLELYGTDEDPGEIFADIGALKEYLVFPDIIFDEFLRNRSKVLDRIADDLRKRETGEVLLPSILRESPKVAALQRTGEDYNRVVWALYDSIQGMIIDPAADPVARAFRDLARDPAVRVFRRTEDLITRAHRRKLLGNPPKSPGTGTIGDEVIWETLLLNLKEDLIFITRDRTYRYHTAYLTEEYRERTGGALTITDRVSDALKMTERPPSAALVRFEGRDEKSAG